MPNKKTIERQSYFENLPMNQVDASEIERLAFPVRPARIWRIKSGSTKVLCSCGGFSSEYGKKYQRPIVTATGFKCPVCGEDLENIGENTTNVSRLVAVMENHHGCDFIRYFWVRKMWDYGSSSATVFEAWRLIYDVDGSQLLMRREFRGPEWNWFMTPSDRLRFIPTNNKQRNRLYIGTDAATGSLSDRFRNAHLECKDMACSPWLDQWLAEITDPMFDHRLETLLINGHYDTVVRFLRRSGEVEYWTQCKMAMRRGYEMTDLWFDHLDTMSRLGMDVTQADLIFPDDLEKVHEQQLRALERLNKKQMLENKIKADLAKLPEYNRKYAAAMQKRIMRYGDVEVTAPGIRIVPLKTIREFADEGTAMSHCLYSSEYFKVSDYLVMSARDESGKRLETVTISIREKKVIACLGAHNKFSSCHNRILYMVNKSMAAILDGKQSHFEAIPDKVMRNEFDEDTRKEQGRLPSIFDCTEEEERFDDIRFKKAYQSDGNEVVIAMKIYSDTESQFLFSAERGSKAFKVTKARVIGIYDMKGRLTDMNEAQSYHDRRFKYEVGSDCKPMNEGASGSGIYCFDTFAGAMNYWFNMNVGFQRAAS